MKKKQLILPFMAMCIALVMTAQHAQGANDNNGEVRITLLETSDVHGCFFPYDFITGKPRAGSIARLSTYVDSLRATLGDGLVLLDNGDILQGQPISYYYNYVDTTQQNIAAQVVNYLGYDAQAVGNHDVEPGHAVYDKWMGEVKCPVLGANIVNTATGSPYVKPYTILHKKGVKIAVLGMLTPAIPNWLAPRIYSGLRIDDIVESCKYWVKYIHDNENPDLVVGLFHSGLEGGIVTSSYCENEALAVARQVEGIDIIFFGHDHVKHNSVENGVLLLNSANNAMQVARADVTLHREGDCSWRLDMKKGSLVDYTTIKPDSQYMSHFKPQLDSVKSWVNQPIGTLESDLSSEDCFFGNSAFTDLILNLQLKLTGADVAFNAPLSAHAVLHKGTITVGDMFNLYRFENQLYVMKLTGEEIRKHLEMSYDLWVNTMTSPSDHLFNLSASNGNKGLWFANPTYNFDSAAGIDYVVDVSKPNGSKVKILRMSNGKPFDLHKTYKVALNSYRANGGGQLLTKGAGIAKDELESRVIYKSARDQRFYLMQEIKREGTIAPKPNNNWRFVPEQWVKPAAQRDRAILFGK